MPPGRPDVTALLQAWEAGDRDAFDRLMPLVYEELRAIAHRQLLGERPGHTLDTTALVHECYLSLVGGEPAEFRGRRQFFGLAATAMRHVLVDYARGRATRKRGSDPERVPLDEAMSVTLPEVDDLLAIDQALTRLAERDPGLVRLVECRFFAGMTLPETAETLGLALRTAEREWTRAKAHLHRELTDAGVDPSR